MKIFGSDNSGYDAKYIVCKKYGGDDSQHFIIDCYAKCEKPTICDKIGMPNCCVKYYDYKPYHDNGIYTKRRYPKLSDEIKADPDREAEETNKIYLRIINRAKECDNTKVELSHTPPSAKK